MIDVFVTQVDEDTVRLGTTIFFDKELPRVGVAVLKNIVKTEVEAYTGFATEVVVSPSRKEAHIVVYKGWDPVSLGSDIQDLVVAAGYARDSIEKEEKE